MTTQTVPTKTDPSTPTGKRRLALCMAREAEQIGARMKEARESLGWTQRELAAKLPGKTEGKDIPRWENSKHRPTPDTLSHVADALGITVADLHAGPVADREPKGPTPDPFSPAERAEAPGDLHAHEQAAIARHAEVMTELGRLRRLLEAQETNGRQDGHSAANG